MGEIASRGQLRMGFARVAFVTVPLILLLGIASGVLGGSGADDPWYQALAKPSFQPAPSLFPIAWTILYVLLGIALALVIDARGAPGRGPAIAAFAAQFALNLLWSPLFFGAHQVTIAFWVIAAMIVLTGLTILLFRRIRPVAALLLLPYLAWLCFAAALNLAIDRLNPDAETLAPGSATTQIP